MGNVKWLGLEKDPGLVIPVCVFLEKKCVCVFIMTGYWTDGISVHWDIFQIIRVSGGCQNNSTAPAVVSLNSSSSDEFQLFQDFMVDKKYQNVQRNFSKPLLHHNPPLDCPSVCSLCSKQSRFAKIQRKTQLPGTASKSWCS